MNKKVSSRNTKSEILKEYDALFNMHVELEKQVQRLVKDKQKLEEQNKQTPEQKESAHRKIGDEEKKTPAEIKPAATSIGPIVQDLKNIHATINIAINELSSQLVSEASALAEMTDQFNNVKNNLESSYQIQLEPDTLQKLIQDYDSKTELFQTQLRQKREALDEKNSTLNKSWQKEQEEHARAEQERIEAEKLTSKREQEEYDYNMQRKRDQETQEHQHKVKELKKELQQIESAKKNEWDIREKEIFEKEQELLNLKSQVDNFDKKLEKEIKTAEEITGNRIEKELQTKFDLRKKEVEGEYEIYESKIEAFEALVKKQDIQIQSLNTQLNSALKQAQDLALKAIESASHSTSFSSIKEIALEQAKNLQKRQ